MEKHGRSTSVQVFGIKSLKNGLNEKERENEYVQMKSCPTNESFTDGSVRESEMMAWKYDYRCGGCEQVKIKAHVLFECRGTCVFICMQRSICYLNAE